jgi:hypothetical protein
VQAIRANRLKEPFGCGDFKNACPGFGEGTYKAFLYKHKIGNGSTSELFAQVGIGKFRLLKPANMGFE